MLKGNAFEFVTYGGGADAWIDVTFDACYVLQEVRILQRVSAVDNAQLIHIVFDDESVQPVKRFTVQSSCLYFVSDLQP